MPNTQLNIWRKYLPDCMYVNMYGPTEATDIATYYIVDREYENHETLPIGKVCRNMRALILNDDDKQCAVGEQGELCISGTGIALHRRLRQKHLFKIRLIQNITTEFTVQATLFMKMKKAI